MGLGRKGVQIGVGMVVVVAGGGGGCTLTSASVVSHRRDCTEQRCGNRTFHLLAPPSSGLLFRTVLLRALVPTR